MQNVIAFPKEAVEAPVKARTTGAKTLFIHIRSTTLIVHLAASTVEETAGTKIGKRI